MRIVAFFSAIAVIILLLAGCGHEKSNNSQVVNLVQLGGVEYSEIPKSNIIQLEKSDFPKGEIRSIERIPIDLEIELREVNILAKGNYLIVKHLEWREGAYLLHVLSLPDYKTVAQLAPFGEGPDEFNDIRMIPTEETDKLCYVWNIRNNRIFSLSTTLKLEEYDQLAEIPENKIVLMSLYIWEMARCRLV